MTFEIRTATPGDGRAIAEVQKETHAATYTRWVPDIVDNYDLGRFADFWAHSATVERGHLTVAEDDGEILAFCASGPARSDSAENQQGRSVEGAGEVYAVYVRPAAHGRGIGRALMADALTWLTGRGHPECILWVAEPSTRTRRFYEQVGFVHEDGVTDPWRNGLMTVRYRLTLVE